MVVLVRPFATHVRNVLAASSVAVPPRLSCKRPASAFVIDADARKIVGWRVSTSAHAGFVLDALEQAVHDRRPGKAMGLVHHSDRGSQYLSIRYTERLAEAGIEPSVGVRHCA